MFARTFPEPDATFTPRPVPPIDLKVPSRLETATFASG